MSETVDLRDGGAGPALGGDAVGTDAAAQETKGERTRRRLLEIAIERFGRRGYRATSVSEIARAAGLTQAASYAYFDSKEALFQAAVDADADGLLRGLVQQLEDVPVGIMVPTAIVHLVAGLEHHPLAKRVLAGQEPESIERLVDLDAIRHFSDTVADRLRAAQEAGEIRSDFDPPVLAAGIETLVLGLLFSIVQSNNAATPRAEAGVVAAFDLMLRPPQ